MTSFAPLLIGQDEDGKHVVRKHREADDSQDDECSKTFVSGLHIFTTLPDLLILWLKRKHDPGCQDEGGNNVTNEYGGTQIVRCAIERVQRGFLLRIAGDEAYLQQTAKVDEHEERAMRFGIVSCSHGDGVSLSCSRL